MMWWAIWCAAVAAGGACAAAAPAPESIAPLTPLDFLQIDNSAPDDESMGYGVPPMGGRYAAAPWLYLLSDLPREPQVTSKESRRRRSFSVNPAIELLQRGAKNNYIERLAHSNRNFLNCVGKRDPWLGADCQMKN